MIITAIKTLQMEHLAKHINYFNCMRMFSQMKNSKKILYYTKYNKFM